MVEAVTTKPKGIDRATLMTEEVTGYRKRSDTKPILRLDDARVRPRTTIKYWLKMLATVKAVDIHEYTTQ